MEINIIRHLLTFTAIMVTLCAGMYVFAQESASDAIHSIEVAKYAKVKVTALMEGPYSVIVSSITVMPDKNLLCVYSGTQDYAKSIGLDITGKSATLGRISTDHGETWGKSFVVLDCPAENSAGDPALVTVGKKVIAIASVDTEAYDPPKGKIQLWQVESSDNGLTWSKPSAIPVPRTRPAVSGRTGIVLKDGTVLMPYWWDFMIQTGAFGMAQIGDIPTVCGTMISRDQGKTWNLSTDIYGSWSTKPSVLLTADEPAIVALSNKDIMMVIRSTQPDGRTNETWSHDGGVTWELPKLSPITSYNTPSCLYQMKNGWVVRMWNDSTTPNRFPLVVSISKDNCKTWSTPKTVVEFPKDSAWPVQASYPSVVETTPGNLVATWCHTNPDHRWFLACGMFTADWILKEAETVPIVAFGDSITLGVRAEITEAQTFRHLLQERLAAAGHKVKMINAGLGSSNTEDAVARLESDVLRYHPKVVIVNFGMNDAAMVDGHNQTREAPRVPEAEFRANLERIVQDSQRIGSKIILCTPTPMTRAYPLSNEGAYITNDMNYQLTKYAQIVREVSRKYRTKLVDLFAFFTARSDRMKLVYDGCHPDADGQALMAEQIYPVLEDML